VKRILGVVCVAGILAACGGGDSPQLTKEQALDVLMSESELNLPISLDRTVSRDPDSVYTPFDSDDFPVTNQCLGWWSLIYSFRLAPEMDPQSPTFPPELRTADFVVAQERFTDLEPDIRIDTQFDQSVIVWPSGDDAQAFFDSVPTWINQCPSLGKETVRSPSEKSLFLYTNRDPVLRDDGKTVLWRSGYTYESVNEDAILAELPAFRGQRIYQSDSSGFMSVSIQGANIMVAQIVTDADLLVTEKDAGVEVELKNQKQEIPDEQLESTLAAARAKFFAQFEQ